MYCEEIRSESGGRSERLDRGACLQVTGNACFVFVFLYIRIGRTDAPSPSRDAARRAVARAFSRSSGGSTPENVDECAETSVNVVSVGSLVYASNWPDVSMLVRTGSAIYQKVQLLPDH
jgi:hypothetical protein